jgi:4,5-DOPA dioxygenase extradiol
VLILGSGNIVHNLRLIRWEDDADAYDWAGEFDAWVEQRLVDGDIEALADYRRRGPSARLAAPTPDHYLPLLYAAAVRGDSEALEFTHTGLEMGSVSMRCMLVG